VSLIQKAVNGSFVSEEVSIFLYEYTRGLATKVDGAYSDIPIVS
jgi:hypothetical protein